MPSDIGHTGGGGIFREQTARVLSKGTHISTLIDVDVNIEHMKNIWILCEHSAS